MTHSGGAQTAYRIDVVTAQTLEHYRAVRLAMLLDTPAAFGSRYADTVVHERDWWLAKIAKSPTWLAWQADRPVGSVGMWADPEAGDGASLIGLWVAPPARGTGVGEALIATVIEAARAQGCARVVLEVAQENAPARRLYERLGFVATGEAGVPAGSGGISLKYVLQDGLLGPGASPV